MAGCAAGSTAPAPGRAILPEGHSDTPMAQLDPEDHAAIGLFLLTRRDRGLLIDDPAALPPLATLEDVYAIQTGLTATGSTLGPHIGWKCGACSPAAQASLQLSEPFRAPLFGERVHTDVTTVDRTRVNLTLLEAEFAFQMARDLPPRSSGAYSADEVTYHSTIFGII